MTDAVAERPSIRTLLASLFDVPSRAITAHDLVPDYLEEKRLAASLKAHAQKMPYPFLQEAMEGLAAETEAHAEAIEGLLRAHRIEPPELPETPRITSYTRIIHDLDDDLNAIKGRIVRYFDLLKNAPPEIARVLQPIYEDKRRHEPTLVEVAIRVVR